MSEPKISERMTELVLELEAASWLWAEANDEIFEQNVSPPRDAVFLAIAELEQERDQWREAAVAWFHVFPERTYADTQEAHARLNKAIAALGPKWDEAMEGETT